MENLTSLKKDLYSICRRYKKNRKEEQAYKIARNTYFYAIKVAKTEY